MTPQEHDEITKLINDGYLGEDMEPLKCDKCECDVIRTTIIALDGGRLSEKSAHCDRCNAQLGYWSYGNWEC